MEKKLDGGETESILEMIKQSKSDGAIFVEYFTRNICLRDCLIGK